MPNELCATDPQAREHIQRLEKQLDELTSQMNRLREAAMTAVPSDAIQVCHMIVDAIDGKEEYGGK